jgi:hypothetical protein
VSWLPEPVFADEGVGEHEHFAHDGGYGDLGHFSFGDSPKRNLSLPIQPSYRQRKFEPKLLIFDGESSQVHERIAKSIAV